MEHLPESLVATMAITICKEEINKTIPDSVINPNGDNFPWGRAFARVIAEIRQLKDRIENEEKGT